MWNRKKVTHRKGMATGPKGELRDRLSMKARTAGDSSFYSICTLSTSSLKGRSDRCKRTRVGQALESSITVESRAATRRCRPKVVITGVTGP
jgi:hypothetical protein